MHEFAVAQQTLQNVTCDEPQPGRSSDTTSLVPGASGNRLPPASRLQPRRPLSIPPHPGPDPGGGVGGRAVNESKNCVDIARGNLDAGV